METWKLIKNTFNRYYINNVGEVLDTDYRKTGVAKILKYKVPKYVYPRVTLYFEGIGYKSVSIHRLVAEAFVSNPNHYDMVNHKDEIKTNNYYENLEWVTASQNVNYGTRNQRAWAQISLSLYARNKWAI